MSVMVLFLASALILPVGLSYAQTNVTASRASIQNMTNQTGMNQTGTMHPGMKNQTTTPTNSTVSLPVTTHKILSPLQQVKSGVAPKDVQCKQGFTLIIKAEDGSPACVDPTVSQILLQRGWGMAS